VSGFKGFTFERGYIVRVSSAVHFVPGQVRRVIRLALRGQSYELAKECVVDLANRLMEEAHKGELVISPEHRREIAEALLAITQGADAQQIFGLARQTGGQEKAERHMLIALDYWLRRHLRPSELKTYAKVASDWQERSETTIKGITRRWRAAANHLVTKWTSNGDGDLYLDAIAAARHKLLTGEEQPILKHPHETIQVALDLSLIANPDGSNSDASISSASVSVNPATR
jgi:hypothetical protein